MNIVVTEKGSGVVAPANVTAVIHPSVDLAAGRLVVACFAWANVSNTVTIVNCTDNSGGGNTWTPWGANTGVAKGCAIFYSKLSGIVHVANNINFNSSGNAIENGAFWIQDITDLAADPRDQIGTATWSSTTAASTNSRVPSQNNDISISMFCWNVAGDTITNPQGYTNFTTAQQTMGSVGTAMARYKILPTTSTEQDTGVVATSSGNSIISIFAPAISPVCGSVPSSMGYTGH